MKTLKIIIGDNSKHFREGLKRILQNIGGVEVIGETDNGAELLEMLEMKSVDIVFLDIILSEISGVEVTRIGHSRFPATSFIGFSSLENERYAKRMLEAGASGYLRKSGDNYEFFRNIIENKSGLHHSPKLLHKDSKLSLSGRSAVL